VPEGEWGAFMAALRRPLPTTFRINGSGRFAEGLREKVRFVMAEMGRRMGLLGMGWQDATSVQAYTVADIGIQMHDELVATGAARHGLYWHHSRPPLAVLDYEMDVRGPTREHHLRA
jgi:hypothetical protein